jgi:hypothetical protein
VIAEGIEDLDQADWLLRHGCAMAQGYAFGRPAPLPSTADLLIGELTDVPAELMTEQTPAALTDELPEGAVAALHSGTGVSGTADTGELPGVGIDDEDDEDAEPADGPVLPFPVQRSGALSDGLVDAATGELDPVEDDD